MRGGRAPARVRACARDCCVTAAAPAALACSVWARGRRQRRACCLAVRREQHAFFSFCLMRGCLCAVRAFVFGLCAPTIPRTCMESRREGRVLHTPSRGCWPRGKTPARTTIKRTRESPSISPQVPYLPTRRAYLFITHKIDKLPVYSFTSLDTPLSQEPSQPHDWLIPRLTALYHHLPTPAQHRPTCSRPGRERREGACATPPRGTRLTGRTTASGAAKRRSSTRA